MLLAVYGSATTLAVTRDVRTATSGILESILFMPINVLEGLLSFFLPLAVIIDLIWHRRWRSLTSAVGSAISAVGIANKLSFVFILFMFGVNSGASVFSAQFWGKGDLAAVR